jgi:hypothetical protein
VFRTCHRRGGGAGAGATACPAPALLAQLRAKIKAKGNGLLTLTIVSDGVFQSYDGDHEWCRGSLGVTWTGDGRALTVGRIDFETEVLLLRGLPGAR